MTSKLELHNIVKPCVNRRDYLRIYSNPVLPEGTQKVKFYGIGSKEPNKRMIEKYLENCGFTNVSVTVRHSGRKGHLIRSLAIYARAWPGVRTWTESPPYFFAQAKETKVKSHVLDTRKAQEDAFNAQRPLTKKECLKIKPGTWIVLKWMDSENTVVLLLERLENCLGDVDLCYYDPHIEQVSRHAVHSQIVGVRGRLENARV